jgi:hypothetical protein
MLVQATDQLATMTRERMYPEAANLLQARCRPWGRADRSWLRAALEPACLCRPQAVNQLLVHFDDYKEIQKINDLREQIGSIRDALRTQIFEDFNHLSTQEGTPNPAQYVTWSNLSSAASQRCIAVSRPCIAWRVSSQVRDALGRVRGGGRARPGRARRDAQVVLLVAVRAVQARLPAGRRGPSPDPNLLLLLLLLLPPLLLFLLLLVLLLLCARLPCLAGRLARQDGAALRLAAAAAEAVRCIIEPQSGGHEPQSDVMVLWRARLSRSAPVSHLQHGSGCRVVGLRVLARAPSLISGTTRSSRRSSRPRGKLRSR